MRVAGGIVGTAALALLPAACGGGSSIEGKYTAADDETLYEEVTLGSDGVAAVVFPLGLGNSGQGSYVVEGTTITVTVPDGAKPVFQLANDCLIHPIVGRLCKGGSRSGSGGSAAPAAAAAAGGGGAETYEATTEQGRIVLELLGGGTARMTMTPFGGGGGDVPQRMTFDVSYERSGDGVTLVLPGEGPTQLERSGRDLLMTSNGETARFIRQ
jgi:hypothetical protein